MTDPRIIIAGARGMLGFDVTRVFEEAFPGRVTALGRDALDVTRPESIARVLKECRPSVVINTSGYTNVDGAETDREGAHLLNGLAPGYLAEGCREMGAKLVHFSTDQVFDGSGEAPHAETDPVAPANHYAATKLEGERAALTYERSLVIRVQWLYGEKKDRFTLLRDKAVFTPFADQYGAPTWTRDIAHALLGLLERDAAGLFHFAYDDFASWAEVFAFVKTELGLATQLLPKRTAEVTLPARRPLNSRLLNRKLAHCLGVPGMGSWKDSLRAFLRSR